MDGCSGSLEIVGDRGRDGEWGMIGQDGELMSHWLDDYLDSGWTDGRMR